MDTAANLLERYTFLLSILNNAGDTGLTLAQIENKWNARFGAFQARTFHRQREAIGEVFPVEIECTRDGGISRYRLRPSKDMSPARKIAFASLNSFLLGNELSHDRLPMDRMFMSSAYCNRLTMVFADGISKERSVRFKYKRDRSAYRRILEDMPSLEHAPEEVCDTVKVLEICPYAIAFETYWFVIGVFPGGTQLKVFTLERICEAELTDKGFAHDPMFNYRSIRENVMARYGTFPTEGGGKDDDDRLLFLTVLVNMKYVNIL